MKNKTIAINLFKKGDNDFIEKFINWALSIGRLVVILTEGIALLAFLYRFTLDRQVIDLHDEITKKQDILKYFKPNEDKYRNIQTKLLFVSKIESSAESLTNMMNETIDSAPGNFLISNIYLSENNIKVEANARSLIAITTFINSLKNNPRVNNVSLDKIENRTSNSIIVVTISADFK